jgi:hypothetical protein
MTVLFTVEGCTLAEELTAEERDFVDSYGGKVDYTDNNSIILLVQHIIQIVNESIEDDKFMLKKRGRLFWKFLTNVKKL